MGANEIVQIKKNTLDSESKRLKSEADSSVAMNPPTLSGKGKTANRLNELVENMKKLHTKALELINESAAMLSKMGYEFDELDKVTSEIYKTIK